MKTNLEHWVTLQEKGYFENHPFYQERQVNDDAARVEKATPLTKDMKIAIIGCGYGRESASFCRRVRKVYGIDVSWTILAKALERMLADNHVNFTPVLASQWKTILPDGGLDLVYSVVVFQHLTRDLVDDYIGGLKGKLRPGGRFYVQFCDSDTGEADADLRFYEPNVRWTEDDIRILARRHGLDLLSLDSERVTPTASWHWALMEKADDR
ncbi:class I SAM-dependent methyltransferase [Rhodospirillum rubrum]|uniref:Methyltransferase domain-containing protein n=1 Tax=Rhodospirillum rubrum (strain ATCC 11170 / ATH 1.1.1 / DSM 467 / LMG 4362 / NCIMB 8255 / S1) TaxID=269796 RepID=Q2RQR3_RHORT|nr:class I SAM-dependent methyltransferase [Rhodospirillum rubrum]ABC23532.1 hypothetical protein Rru_A2735 [Rhodospirillum rubrum ATCC 11170]AEO49271.1 hypothetical protein F11_14045 [Rhodospirillum rubrum F11]MBK5955205.1 SAM-dependent methyltransferase [Rhodospirillum rubrum]QXG79499.1 class I SAM-dependent methyltransferase [Rhodospirillum rubrum]HAP98545.1 class I SAM-dependent methyltransferase [Rhodospirillum rubrum]